MTKWHNDNDSDSDYSDSDSDCSDNNSGKYSKKPTVNKHKNHKKNSPRDHKKKRNGSVSSSGRSVNSNYRNGIESDNDGDFFDHSHYH